jgi:hypothetical protein
MDQQPLENLQARNPALITRVLYALGAFSVIPVTVIGSSSWIGLATGAQLVGQPAVTVFLLTCAAIVFRIYQVLRYPRALDSWPSGWVAKGFRGLAIVAMLVGGFAGVGLFLIGPITYALMKTPGDNGIGFFVVGLYLVFIASVGWKGCVVYEITRLAGRPPKGMRPPSSFRWKQDTVVALVLVIVCVGAPAFQRLTAPPRCEGNRIACVSTTQADIKRMVALPLETPVHFESSVKSIDLQKHSGNQVKWLLSESPAVSLKATGYPPTTDVNATIRIKVDAMKLQDGVVMHLLVWEGSQQVARFTTTFGPGSKLEQDAQGEIHITTEVPSNIDSMIKGTWEDEQGRRYMLDQIYLLLRQAIGTEEEVRESALRLVRSARVTSQVEGDTGTAGAKAGFEFVPISARCADLVTLHRDGRVRSASLNDLGAQMRQVHFMRSPDAPPANLHSNEQVFCEGGRISIVSYSTANPLFSLRRYSEDGKLLRFVQSPLPAPKEGFDFIDLATLRESAKAITFDRIGAQIKNGQQRFIKRETFEISL